MAPPAAPTVMITLKNGDRVKVNGAWGHGGRRLGTQADFLQTTFTARPAGPFATGPLIR